MAEVAERAAHPAPGDRRVPLLQAQHIALAFGAVQALSDVSVDIGAGEILAIIGPNGAGKTSLLNVINGFYQPQRGTIAPLRTTEPNGPGSSRPRWTSSP